MDGELAAIQLARLEQPLAVQLELGQPQLDVLFLLHREVGHDADRGDPLEFQHGQGIGLGVILAQVYAVTAHAGGVQADVHRHVGVMALCDVGDPLGALQAAYQLFQLVGQRLLYLDRGGGTDPHQAALEALLAGHAGLFIAGDADAGNARLDHGGDQQIDAVTVGVGLHDGADLRALVAETILEGLDVVLEGGQIHFQPGVGGGLLLAVAGVTGQRQIGGGDGLAGEQPEDQGREQGFLVHGMVPFYCFC
ncbi:hypothetical protein D3C80_718930 [compost metagenome]